MNEIVNTLGVILLWVLALGVYLAMVGMGCATFRMAYKDYTRYGGPFDLTMLVAFAFISASMAALPLLYALDHLLK